MGWAKARNRIATNPLLVREMRRSKRLSLRSTLWLGIGASLAGVLLLGFVARSSQEAAPLSLLVALCTLTTLSTPPFVAYAAATLSAGDVSSRPYELVHLTSLSDAQIIVGYISGALYRCRALLSLALTPTLVMVVGGLYVTQYQLYLECLASRNAPSRLCGFLLPSAGDILALLPDYLLAAVSIWGAIILAAALGVGLALWWRNTWLASSGALVLLVVLVAAAIASTVGLNQAEALQANLLFAPAPYVLAGGIVVIAQPLARRQE